MHLYLFALAFWASNAMAVNQFTYNGTAYNATDTFNQTAQVSVLFPRNTTYAPQEIMPLIVAVDNYAGMLALQPKFHYSLFNASAATADREFGLDSNGLNDGMQQLTSSGDRSFWLKGIRSHTHKDGMYRLRVSVAYTNCSVGRYCGGEVCRDGDDDFQRSANYWTHDTYFTVSSKDAKRDLGFRSMFEGISSGSQSAAECNKTGAVAFDVRAYVPLPAGYVFRPEPMLPYCAVLAETSPKAQPCKILVDEDDARLFNDTIYAGECRLNGKEASCSAAGDKLGLAKAAWVMMGAVFSILLLC